MSFSDCAHCPCFCFWWRCICCVIFLAFPICTFLYPHFLDSIRCPHADGQGDPLCWPSRDTYPKWWHMADSVNKIILTVGRTGNSQVLITGIILYQNQSKIRSKETVDMLNYNASWPRSNQRVEPMGNEKKWKRFCFCPNYGRKPGAG